MEGEGGDQLCGLAASGLPLTDVSFANLPPHFTDTGVCILTEDEWNEILPGYSTYYPLNFREVIPYLLASLVYHQPYLAGLHKNHPLFKQRVWTSGILINLKDKVGAGCNRNEISKMTATGVPPHLIIGNTVVGLQNEMKEMKVQVLQKLDQLPQSLKEAMLTNFQVNGAVPLTRQDMEVMFGSSMDAITAQMEEMIRRYQPPNALLAPGPVPPESVVAVAAAPSRSYASWTWGGRLHPISQGSTFPM
jgi:hypothetical protein